MVRAVPDHLPEDFVLLSDSKVRDMLAGRGAGGDLPEEVARPESGQNSHGVLPTSLRSTSR